MAERQIKVAPSLLAADFLKANDPGRIREKGEITDE